MPQPACNDTVCSLQAPRSSEGVRSANLRVSQEEGFAIDQLCKDAADAPHVNRRGIDVGAQQDLRSSVQQCHNLCAANALLRSRH